MSKSTQTQNFFNLHTNGIGYLNNIREVPNKGNTYLSCNIAALTGDSSKPNYRYFNVNVVGSENELLIRKCQQAVDARKKILIAFTFGDLWTEIFTYDKDSQYHQKGDTGVMIKARLIRIKSISIDGKKVYQEEPKEQYSTSVPVSTPQIPSEPEVTAEFDEEPVQHQKRQPSSRIGRKQPQNASAQYPEDSF